ncbi:TRAP transporter small permease [Tianweitania sp. BSSL-BM11]|uniref:TRAP transporter small permease protein n=1 Tax=Tianweitania aestuarii TaxID=2814886 RepID=A0ABS5RXA8_9HYPH|nr:TRAP transporter small permease [Tianweitania aestuarii]
MGKAFDRLEEIIAILLLGGTVSAVIISAVGRSVGHPVPAGNELAQLLLIWTCMLGADLVVRRGEHIRISSLPDALPRIGRMMLHLVCVVCILSFLAYCGWLGWHLAMSNWAREMGASGLSYGWVTLAFPTGCVLMIISIIRRIATLGLLFSIEPEARQGEQLL